MIAPLPLRPIRVGLAALAAVAFAAPARAAEPRWDAVAEASYARLGAVEESAVSAGPRLTFRVAGPVAVDAGALFAPADLGEPAFSGSLTELSAGLRVGTAPDPVGVYAAVRGGSVRYAEAPAALACIAIFPPPLECVLSQGRNAAQLQLAAGVEARLGGPWLLRVEGGDRLVRMPGPVFDASGEIREDDFWSHELRLAVAVGLRF